MAVSVFAALLGVYLARKWWLALLLSISGALLGRACFDAFLYFQSGTIRAPAAYVDIYIASAVTGLLVFPSYFLLQARRRKKDIASNLGEAGHTQKPGKWTSAR